MRDALRWGLLVMLSSGVAVTSDAQSGAGGARVPVLVELFTSEGCSSCPPADRLLGELDRGQPVAGAEILVMGEHVDYWDELGWHDRFSSSLFTARQQAYAQRFGIAGPYTPQMVVDGRTEFVGSDRHRATEAIRTAAVRRKLGLTMEAMAVSGRRVAGEVAIGGGEAAKGATMYAALVDPVDVTEVRNGENGGRRLMHAGVVRTLVQLRVPESGGRVAMSLMAPADATISAMRMVVFLVDAQGAVIGAAAREVAGGMASAARQP